MTRDDVMRETLNHVRRVGDLMLDVVEKLQRRAMHHDDSKFSSEEFESFATATPALKGLTYGSDEYRQTLRRIKPTIELHYSKNSHHPEHYKNGIRDMDLLDIIEMLADWKAAGERHADGSLVASIEKNQSRFGYDDQFARLLAQTAINLGWLNTTEECPTMSSNWVRTNSQPKVCPACAGAGSFLAGHNASDSMPCGTCCGSGRVDDK